MFCLPPYDGLMRLRLARAATVACLLLLAAAAFAADTPAPNSPAAVLTAARREAVLIRFPSARAVALSEVALRFEQAGDTEVAFALWQQAQFEAVSPRDELDRIMARTAVAARMLRSSTQKDTRAAFLADVYKTAQQLRVARDRALALRELAPILRSTDPNLWAEALAKAAEAARLIPEPIVRATSYAQLATTAAAFDTKFARQMAAEAEKAWRLAEPSDERNLAAAELSRAWAPLDWEHALDFSLALTDTPARAQALRAAAEELACRDLDKALVAVQKTPGPELRAVALAAVASKAVCRRADLAAMLAEQAVASVVKAPPTLRDLVAEAAAVALAPTDVDRALALAKSVTDEDSRAQATVAVAAVLAPKDAARALDVLKALDRPELVEPALPDILHYLARTDADGAVKRARALLERYLRALALLRIWDALSAQAPGSPIPAGG
jgi:hypothetical protein